MDASFEDGPWLDLARRFWLKDTPVLAVKPETLKTEIYDRLEAERFPLRSIAALEQLQILEK